jgi:hypothetical protein
VAIDGNRRLLGVLVLAALMAGCGGSSSSSSAGQLSSASTCAQWHSAGREAQQQYVAQAVGEQVEGGGHYTDFSSQSTLDGWLTKACTAAVHAGNAAITALGSIATGSQAKQASSGEAVTPATETTPAASTTSTPAAKPAGPEPEPNENRTPDFMFTGKTENGDRLRLEGWIGPVLPPSQSDIAQNILESCPRYDGRELVARVDMTVTIESGLSGSVVVGGFVPPFADERHLLDDAMKLSEGPTCVLDTGENAPSVNLGTLTPHHYGFLIMWVILLDAVTPSDPHPSHKTLAQGDWIMGTPYATVDGALVQWSGQPSNVIPLVR